MKTTIALVIALTLSAFAEPPVGPPLPPAEQKTKIKITWDILNEPSVTGFRVHLGPASRSYTESIDVGMPVAVPAENKYDVPHLLLKPGTTYFIAITAYNAYGLESEKSNEISFTTPDVPQAPGNLRVEVVIETSSNLTDWEPIAKLYQPQTEKQFFRLAISPSK